MSKEVLQEALELLAVATFITPKLQAKRTDVIKAGLQALDQPAQQEPVTYWDLSENEMPVRPRLYDPEEHPNHVPLYTTPPAQRKPQQGPEKYLQLALEALAPLEKLFTQADKQGLLTGANVDCQLSVIDLRQSAYAASDIRAHLNTSPPAQQEPVTNEENEKFSRDVSNFKGTDETATMYALEKFLKGRRAPQPAQRTELPDAITDDSESPEYRTGWNECREAMKGMMK